MGGPAVIERLRVDSDYSVYMEGRKIGVLSSPISTQFDFSRGSDALHFFQPHLNIHFSVADDRTEPPAPPKRSVARSLGLRKPTV